MKRREMFVSVLSCLGVAVAQRASLRALPPSTVTKEVFDDLCRRAGVPDGVEGPCGEPGDPVVSDGREAPVLRSGYIRTGNRFGKSTLSMYETAHFYQS